MAQAIAARRHGDDFQSRLFWLRAASLLAPEGAAVKVGYETGPKSFDDIFVEYDPDRAPQDHEGHRILRRHTQCKWHTTAGTFGFADLADPAFLNAQRFSLLQRALAAQQQHAPNGLGLRLELVTNWRINAGDPLLDLVRKESDAIDLDRLFEGKTPRARMGQVRKHWTEHLQIDDAALNPVARVLAIAEAPESLASLRERLDDKLAAVGMVRVPSSEAGFFYDDLTAKLLSQGRIEFDRDGFLRMAKQEGLLDPSGPRKPVRTIGIRSFLHPIDALEERCVRILNLVPSFDGRYIRDEKNWQAQLLPSLRDFLLEEARATDALRLIVDAHVSLAFAAGAVLNVKAGKRIEIEQRTAGRRFWSMNDEQVDPSWPALSFTSEVIDGSAPETSVAISLTHDISADVRAYIKQRAPDVGRILQCRPSSGPSQASVKCGAHAWSYAEAVVKQVRQMRAEGWPAGRLHIFIAAPNGFVFFLGQNQQALGPVALYEWDFDGMRGGGYSLGLRFDN